MLSLISASSLPFLEGPLFAVDSNNRARLPNVRQVAIVPVYWQGQFPESPRFNQNKKQIETNFSRIVRASKRFVFTNDVLAADLWSTAEGRRQLAEEYEVDGLINLTISGQGDTLLWTVRLLDPSMRNYLTETERMPFAWLLSATDTEVDKRLQNLLFRMLNRFPVDVYVTSMQGRYVTLSSGSEQNIFEGDELKFYQTSIRTQHPADGSWLNFDQKLLGKAKVIESKSSSAIALITALSYTDAIRVGDGAQVEAIATRRSFQQKPSQEQFYMPVTPDSPLVEAKPLLGSEAARKQAEIRPKSTLPRTAEAETDAPREVQEPQRLPSATEVMPPTPAENPTVESSNSSNDYLPIAFKEVQVQPQNENFDFSGSAKATSQFPIYLLNRVDIAALQDMTDEVQGIARAHVRFGSTSKGSYLGFGLGFEALYQIPAQTPMITSLDRILVGAQASFESLAVDGEKFGGWDHFSISPALHLQGAYHVVNLAQTFDYDLAARFAAFDSGEVGVSGQKRTISDSMNLEFEANVIRRMKTNDWEWGGMFGYQTGSWNLSKGSIDSSNLRLGLTGRLRF